MRQGITKLALYGLGNMRDERLGRLFQTPGAVTWCAFIMNKAICENRVNITMLMVCLDGFPIFSGSGMSAWCACRRVWAAAEECGLKHRVCFSIRTTLRWILVVKKPSCAST